MSRARPAALESNSIGAELLASPSRRELVKVVILDLLRLGGMLTDDALWAAYERRAAANPSVPTVTAQRVRTARAALARSGHVVASPIAGVSAHGNRATQWTLPRDGAAR